ncbi:MAG: hypothetical protein H0W88_09880 [Parachlamydiaceae bacterium]|nr:hypothetical protein [Parachlamydiaceae bacterium]
MLQNISKTANDIFVVFPQKTWNALSPRDKMIAQVVAIAFSSLAIILLVYRKISANKINASKSKTNENVAPKNENNVPKNDVEKTTTTETPVQKSPKVNENVTTSVAQKVQAYQTNTQQTNVKQDKASPVTSEKTVVKVSAADLETAYKELDTLYKEIESPNYRKLKTKIEYKSLSAKQTEFIKACKAFKKLYEGNLPDTDNKMINNFMLMAELQLGDESTI